MKHKYKVEFADGTSYEVALEHSSAFTVMDAKIKQDAKERGFRSKVTGWEQVEADVNLAE